MLSYQELCAQYQTPPPAPAAVEEPCVLHPWLQTMTAPYSKTVHAVLAQYESLRYEHPQLLQNFLGMVWWEYARSISGITSPGRYRRAID
jgi:hypothetical protein